MAVITTKLLLMTVLIRTKLDPLWQGAEDSGPTEADFYPALTFSFFLFPRIHGNVSTMQQHERACDTATSCGEAAVSQSPATFQPGKSLGTAEERHQSNPTGTDPTKKRMNVFCTVAFETMEEQR